MFKTFFLIPLLFLSFGPIALTGKTPMHSQTDLDEPYLEALKWTDPAQYSLPAAGSPNEFRMLSRLEQLFTQYTESYFEAHFESVYAETFYFRDAFKKLNLREDLYAYFIHGMQAIDSANFEFNHVMRSKDEYFIEWTMYLKFKDKDVTESSIGMSRFRFDSEGKVIFHQDYWDPTTIIYRKIPIAKQLIKFVQNKF